MKMYDYYIGFGNWFIKTPFKFIEEECVDVNTQHNFPLAQGIPPSQAIGESHESKLRPTDRTTIPKS